MVDDDVRINTAGFGDLGVGQELRRYIESQRYPRRYRRAYNWVMAAAIVTMLVVVAGSIALPLLAQRAWATYRIQAYPEVWYREYFVGPSPVLALFASSLRSMPRSSAL